MKDFKTTRPELRGVGLYKEIDSRKALINALNVLKIGLKARVCVDLTGDNADPMLEDFNSMLNKFIIKWKLDGDPHDFASLPKEDEL